MVNLRILLYVRYNSCKFKISVVHRTWKRSKKANTFDVGIDLAHSLVMPFIQQRSLVGLRKPLLKKISYIKNINFHQKQSSVEKRYPAVADRKRCETCKYVETKLKKTNLENQRSSAKVGAKVFVVCIQCVLVISA